MATESSIGRRRAQAIRRIEQRSEALAGGRQLRLPRKSRHGAELLLVFQLEAIADFLDEIELPGEESPYETLTNAALKDLLKQRGIEVKSRPNHADLVSALEAADKAAQEVQTNA